MIINVGEQSAADAYFTMTQTVMPRPVAWVLSENEDHSFNLAPFSFFNAINSDPPLVVFSVGMQPDGTSKDTVVNVQARPEFVINIASVGQLPALNETSATLPYGESEIEANQIALADVDGFSLPRVADSKIAMMCNTYEIQTIGNKNQSLVFAEIQSIYLDPQCAEITDKGRLKVYADRIEPLARLGAGEYASFGEVLQAKRPD
jgi:flavin reductase (DIM6/NTAB) family NADH-FMN oxidoreductase RutF